MRRLEEVLPASGFSAEEAKVSLKCVTLGLTLRNSALASVGACESTTLQTSGHSDERKLRQERTPLPFFVSGATQAPSPARDSSMQTPINAEA